MAGMVGVNPLSHKDGFSLVELSIVLVILGLLTGGILSGQSLIRASELRSVTAQMEQYLTAIQSFRDKYSALPGDMPNATQFWGAVDPTPATCVTTASSTMATCNGNGDGHLTSFDGVTWSEYFHAWKQLANAGLIEGSYTGVKACASIACSQPGVNVPAGKMTNSGFSFAYIDPVTSNTDPNWFAGPYGNFFWFGGYEGTAANGDMSAPILKPEEAWNIDTKLDDGLPATGGVIIQKSGGVNCFVTAASGVITYALSTTSQVCSLIFLLKT